MLLLTHSNPFVKRVLEDCETRSASLWREHSPSLEVNSTSWLVSSALPPGVSPAVHSAALTLCSQTAQEGTWSFLGIIQGGLVWEWSDLFFEKPVPSPGPWLAEPSGASPHEGCLPGNQDPIRPTCHLCQAPERHHQPQQPGGCREDPPGSRGERSDGSNPVCLGSEKEREG